MRISPFVWYVRRADERRNASAPETHDTTVLPCLSDETLNRYKRRELRMTWFGLVARVDVKLQRLCHCWLQNGYIVPLSPSLALVQTDDNTEFGTITSEGKSRKLHSVTVYLNVYTPMLTAYLFPWLLFSCYLLYMNFTLSKQYDSHYRGR